MTRTKHLRRSVFNLDTFCGVEIAWSEQATIIHGDATCVDCVDTDDLEALLHREKVYNLSW